ncbi:hypothetical protein VKT23_009415 [Stygiomarasmius scandens]|uniref:Uncharacterized protein n=1 Tax=Marasmiellus scandens TaxID=2682957 RepID=A0ABR1JHY2_9AGAR
MAADKGKPHQLDPGYETDSANKHKPRTKLRKKKKTTADTDYETDDGYMSSSTNKSKKRFFRLGNRSKSTVSEDEPKFEEVPAVPVPPPVFRLPIAERFATTLGDFNHNATLDPPLAAPSSPETPTVPTPKDHTVLPLRRQSSLLTSINKSLSSNRSTPAIRFRDDSDSYSSGERPGYASPAPTFLSQSSTPPTSILSKFSTSPPKQKPIISYPVDSGRPTSPTRSFGTASPAPSSLTATSSASTVKGNRRLPGPLFIQQSPPSEASSPFVVVPGEYQLHIKTIRAKAIYSDDPQPSRSQSPQPNSNTGLLSAFGFLSRANSKLHPNTNSSHSPSPIPNSHSPSPDHEHGVVPSTDYIVPSPGLPPPNTSVFSHHGHEIPPPSPPPTSPLPEIPPGASPNSGAARNSKAVVGSTSASEDSHSHSFENGYFSAQQSAYPPPATEVSGLTLLNSSSSSSLVSAPVPQSQSQSQNVNVTPSPNPSRSVTPVKRGKESPFPMRPVLPPSVSAPGSGAGAGGFESRVKVPRYRELYALQIPPSSSDESGTRGVSPSTNGRYDRHKRDSSMVGIQVVDPSDDEGEEEREREQVHRRAFFRQLEREREKQLAGSEQSVVVDDGDGDGDDEEDRDTYDSDEEIRNVLKRFKRYETYPVSELPPDGSSDGGGGGGGVGRRGSRGSRMSGMSGGSGSGSGSGAGGRMSDLLSRNGSILSSMSAGTNANAGVGRVTNARGRWSRSDEGHAYHQHQHQHAKSQSQTLPRALMGLSSASSSSASSPSYDREREREREREQEYGYENERMINLNSPLLPVPVPDYALPLTPGTPGTPPNASPVVSAGYGSGSGSGYGSGDGDGGGSVESSPRGKYAFSKPDSRLSTAAHTQAVLQGLAGTQQPSATRPQSPPRNQTQASSPTREPRPILVQSNSGSGSGSNLIPQKSLAGTLLRERTLARMQAASPIPTDDQVNEGWLTSAGRGRFSTATPTAKPNSGPGTRTRPVRDTRLGMGTGVGRAGAGFFQGAAYRAYEVPGLPRSPSRSPYREEFDLAGEREYNGGAFIEEVVDGSVEGGSVRGSGEYEEDDDKSYYPDDDYPDPSGGGRRGTLYQLDDVDPYHPENDNEDPSLLSAPKPRIKAPRDSEWSVSRYMSMYSDSGSTGANSTSNSDWETQSRMSRGSFLDMEKSGDARERFIKRVGEMYDESGREVPPPVPELPKALRAAAANLNNGNGGLGKPTGARVGVMDRVKRIEGMGSGGGASGVKKSGVQGTVDFLGEI